MSERYFASCPRGLEAALAKNDIQVIGEEWAGRSPAWVKAAAEGKVFGLGDTVKGATEGWWVPEYVIKGDPAKGIKPLAPDLRSVSDLKKYKDVFKDPETPSKGRFLNSPIGWTSGVVNKQKLTAYGLQDDFVNFRSGSGAALDAEISSSIRRGKPVVFYYWSPTPLLGKFKLIQLEEPQIHLLAARGNRTVAGQANSHRLRARRAGCAGQGARGQDGAQRVHRADPRDERPRDVRDDVHDVRVALDVHEPLEPGPGHGRIGDHQPGFGA